MSDEGLYDLRVSPQERERILRGLAKDAYRITGWGQLWAGPKAVTLAWVDRAADLRRLAVRHDRVSTPGGLDITVYWKGALAPDGVAPGVLRLEVVWPAPLASHAAFVFALPEMTALVRTAWKARQLLVLEREPRNVDDLLHGRVRGVSVTFDETRYRALDLAFEAYHG